MMRGGTLLILGDRVKGEDRPPRWRRGSGLDFGSEKSGFDSPLTLTACGPSDGKEVKDVFGRPGALVKVGSAR